MTEEDQAQPVEEEREEVSDEARRRKRRSFVSRHLLGTIVVGVIVVVLVVLLWGYLWFSSEESGSPGAGVVFTISQGESFTSVRSHLAHQGVIESSLAFRLYTFVHGAPTLVTGEYYVRKDDSFGNLLGVLSDPPNVLTLQVPPGFTVAEISDRLESAGYDNLGTQFATLATSGKITSPFQPAGSKNLDGLLAPGTYQVLPVESAQALMKQMISRFVSTAKSKGLAPGQTVNGLSAYQVITLASIVEKEGYIEKNMPDVARVIYNRLADGTPLQMDSTVLYSLGQDGGPVTSQDLQIKSPYNTYLNTGLTPTPICFPSDTALSAALHPPSGDWLFFVVVKQDGTEAFSSTYAGQLANEHLAATRGLS